MRCSSPVLAFVLLALSAMSGLSLAADAVISPPELSERLVSLRSEIESLRKELRGLAGKEEGILAELERLGAELRLAEMEHNESALRLEEIGQAIERRTELLGRIESAQGERREYLRARVREIYKGGPAQALRRLVGADSDEELTGVRYASLLSERDLKTLGSYRNDARVWTAERAELEVQQRELAAATDELAAAVERMQSAGRRHRRALASVRQDRKKRQGALAELETAARELSRVVEGLEPVGGASLDIRKFRGLLEHPVAGGKVTATFGTVVHPRFKTRVPHPGWDIEAEFGADIRSVFDGRVVFAGWMRGYGLTAIIDHGGGLLSIYAHASVLLVERSERVGTGRLLGKVGDTGSLRGPFLYFELRVDGEPADPAQWLRGRG